MQFDPKDSDSYSRLISPTFGYHVKEKFKDKVAECKAKGESYGFKPLNAAATQFFSNIQTQVAIKWERIKCYFDKELRGEVRHFNDERIMKLIRAKIVNFDNKVNGRDILSLEDELELMNLMRT